MKRNDVLSRIWILVIIVLGIAFSAYSADSSQPDCSGSGSINDPHVPSGPGPWFEGWYTRVSDVGGSRSVAVIVASYLPKGDTYVPGEYLSGYINVLVCEGDGAPTLSYTVFPEKTMALVNDEPVAENPKISCKKDSDFEWIAEGYGSITQDTIDISIPGVVDVYIHTQNRLPWSTDDPSRSIEGWMAYYPFPTHWWVNSLGSDAEYEYTLYDGDEPETFQGTGYAEQEKNWSLLFPKAWLWSQGISENNTAQYVFTYTRVELFPGLELYPWLASYRSPNIKWNFNFMWAGSYIKVIKDPCAGTCQLTFRDPKRSLIFDMSAPPDSFGDVSIPTADGFIPEMGGESFSATVNVTAYRHYPFFGLKRRVDTQVFENAVLEFGNGWRCMDE
ncbi:MAG: hypothetical protein KJ737_03925 [Proteobacteria bacterium]|nr:hypothetical protein [Pseudomonadota bacterium]